MAAYSDTLKEYHKGRIKDVMILKPGVSIEGIRRVLELSQDPLKLDYRYITKVVQKIRAERRVRMDRQEIKTRISEMQDCYEAVSEQMWKILLDGTADGKGRVMAGKVIIDAQRNLLDAQMEAGVFDRKLGTLNIDHAHEHTLKLPEEIRAPILRAFRNYGILKQQPRIIDAPPLAAAATGGDLQR